MRNVAHLAGALTAALLATACVAPSRMVPVPRPAEQATKVDVSQVAAVLSEFDIRGPTADEIAEHGAAMRASFLDYVAARSTFAKVVDATQAPVEIDGPHVKLTVNLEITVTQERTYLVDYAFFWLLGAISPTWGEGRVQLNVTAIDADGNAFLSEQESYTEEWSILMFGWYRGGPGEDAAARALSRAFDGAAKKVSLRRRDLIARATGQGTGPAMSSVISSSAPRCEAGGTTTSLAAMPLKIQRIEASLGALLDEILVSSVAATGCVKVISAADINAMLGLERMKDAAACDDASCAAEIGGALGVELLLNGTVGRLGENLLVSLTVINVVDREVIGRFTAQIPSDENQLQAHLLQAVSSLLANVKGQPRS